MPDTSSLARLIAGSPLRHPRFRRFYIGSVGSAIGYTMQATVAAWLMATLTPSALMVALVQTASTAPSLLFGLVAGVLADIVDRRRVMLATQAVLIAATVLLGVLTLAGAIGPVTLLVLTFVIGAAFSFFLPAQGASVNDLVSRQDLPRAVALGAAAFNLARAVGPASAGGIAAWLGTGSAMLASAAFFVGMFFAVPALRSAAPGSTGIPETIVSGLRSGLRFARHSRSIRALLVRNFAFGSCAGALWALLPVVARDQLGVGAGGFGLLSGCFGVGAVAGALAMPRQIQRMSLNAVVMAGNLIWIASTVVIATAPNTWIAAAGALGAGVAWVSVLSTLSAVMQTSAPAWVRARAVAMNLASSQASLALSGVFWGWLASIAGTRVALGASAAALTLLLVVMRRVTVSLGTEADVTPGVQLTELTVIAQPMPDDGPVLIQMEYRIDPEHRAEFIRAIQDVEPTRRRNGATSWRLFRDLAEDGRFVERFIIASWAEYVRLRMRATVADRELQIRVARLQRPGVPIRVSRLIGVDPDQPAWFDLDAAGGAAAADGAAPAPVATPDRTPDETPAAAGRSPGQ